MAATVILCENDIELEEFFLLDYHTDSNICVQTNRQTREPLCKGDSRTCLIAFHIQLPLATLASLNYFIFFNFLQMQQTFDILFFHFNTFFQNLIEPLFLNSFCF